MNPEQQRAIALYAAFADSAKHDREREEIPADVWRLSEISGLIGTVSLLWGVFQLADGVWDRISAS